MSGFQKILEKRDLWSIGVYRYDRLEDIFTASPVALAHFHGATGLRVGKNYQSVAADPFLFAHDDRLHMFYEVKTDHGHGTIHAQSMSPDGRWQVNGPVLEEPFHLSYPQVFALGGRIYMLPEAAQSGAVRLYEAEDFPRRWRHCKTLIDAPLRDPTLLVTEEDGLFLLATTVEYELNLYHAESIHHPFRLTVPNITRDRKIARCAGSILKLGDRLIRPAQDCSEYYGKSINFQVIETIKPELYRESPLELKISIPTEPWMSLGSHHISSAHFSDAFYVAVDGCAPDRLINSFTLGCLRIFELNFIKR